MFPPVWENCRCAAGEWIASNRTRPRRILQEVDHQPNQRHDPMVLSVTSLKELFVILVGLAITNGIGQIVALKKDPSGYIDLGQALKSHAFLLFSLLALNSIRFYHGNMRHLDTVYTGEQGKGGAGDLTLDRGNKLAIDFFIMFFQSMVFTLLSFLLTQPPTFYLLFAVLLSTDGLWFLLVHKRPESDKLHAYQKVYYFNNLMCGAAMGALVLVVAPRNEGLAWTVLCAVLLLNTTVDFKLNWNHYFKASDVAVARGAPS